LTGIVTYTPDEVTAASRGLISKGVKVVINKYGKRGAYLITENKFGRFPTYDF